MQSCLLEMSVICVLRDRHAVGDQFPPGFQRVHATHDDRPHDSMNVKRKATSSLSAAVTSPSAPKKLKQGSLTAFFGSPTGSKDLHTAPKVRFDKDAWITSLTPTQKELLKYLVLPGHH